MTYKLIFMSFDGAYVTDSEHDTKESAFEAIENIGSKWFFYPFPFIVMNKTVVETGEGLVNMATGEAYMPKMFKGKRLATIIKAFKEVNDYLNDEGITNCDGYQFEELLICWNYPASHYNPRTHKLINI